MAGRSTLALLALLPAVHTLAMQPVMSRSRPLAMSLESDIEALQQRVDLLQTRVALQAQLEQLQAKATQTVSSAMPELPAPLETAIAATTEPAASAVAAVTSAEGLEPAASALAASAEPAASTLAASAEPAASVVAASAATTSAEGLQAWVEWSGTLAKWAAECSALLATEVQQRAGGLAPPSALDALDAVRGAGWTAAYSLDRVGDVLHTPIVSELTAMGAALQLGAIAAFGLGSLVFTAETNGEAPYQPGTNSYNPPKADEFYRQRPLVVARRLVTLARLTSAFTAGVLFDWLVLGKLLKDEEYTALKNAEPRRAKEALVLCEQLGPTSWIKNGLNPV